MPYLRTRNHLDSSHIRPVRKGTLFRIRPSIETRYFIGPYYDLLTRIQEISPLMDTLQKEIYNTAQTSLSSESE